MADSIYDTPLPSICGGLMVPTLSECEIDGIRTVLFNDGTLAINVLTSDLADYIAVHGSIKYRYDAFDEDHPYIFDNDFNFPLWIDEWEQITAIEIASAISPTDTSWWFWNCSNAVTADVSLLDTSNVTAMGYMFYNCSSLTSLDLSTFDTTNVEYWMDMFYGCLGLEYLDISNWVFNDDTKYAWDIWGYGAYNSLRNVVTLVLDNVNTSNVTDMNAMFRNFESLETIDLLSFDTSNVTDMASMFAGCRSLVELDLTSFDTSNVVSMGSMFDDCNSLLSLDLGNFITTNLQYTSCMFRDCTSLESLWLCSWDGQNISLTNEMFERCSSLHRITTHMNLTGVSHDDRMFYDCTSLVGGEGTAYDANYVDATYARPDDLANNTPGYFEECMYEWR